MLKKIYPLLTGFEPLHLNFCLSFASFHFFPQNFLHISLTHVTSAGVELWFHASGKIPICLETLFNGNISTFGEESFFLTVSFKLNLFEGYVRYVIQADGLFLQKSKRLATAKYFSTLHVQKFVTLFDYIKDCSGSCIYLLAHHDHWISRTPCINSSSQNAPLHLKISISFR